MIRVALATLALWALLAAWCLSASTAQAATLDPLAVANNAWPGSPCTGKLQITLDVTLALRGRAGEAVGVARGDCEFSVDPVYWAKATPQERCQIAAHEAGHLAGLGHSLTGVMRPDHSGFYAPCATLRDRIEHDLQVRTAATNFNVQCGKQIGRVITCRVWLTSHVARFRVAVSGERFMARRVHGGQR